MWTILNQFEKALRLDRFDRSSDLMHARVIYIICGSFVLVQLVNLIVMTRIYGGWTVDHNIALGAVVFVALLTFILRFSSNFNIQAFGVLIMTGAGIFLSATSDGTGINSALLPYIPIAIVMAGLIAGWRMAYIAGALSLGLLSFLYLHSMRVPSGHVFDPAIFAERNTARAVQGSLVIALASIMTGLITHNIRKAFERLENIVRQVRNSERSKTEFMANMGREIHTPLEGIQQVSQHLLDTELSAQQHQYAKIIKDCTTSLTAITEDVLDFTKLDAQCLMLQPSQFEIRQLARSLVFLHYPSAAKKNLKLKLQVDRKTPQFVFADESRIRQVINNLISNAIKFTPQGTVILKVGGKAQKGSRFLLQICVEDTGVGIRSENFRHIFDRFFKSTSTPSGPNPGTGLGLSISKDIVELMGGKLKLQSEIGSGSKFQFTIPVDIPQATTQTHEKPVPWDMSRVA